MDRSEATLIIEYVVKAIHELEDYNGAYEVIPCGSYRRLKETNGDVDILITRLDGRRDTNIFSKLLTKLDEQKFLVDHLTFAWQNN
jgi:DNA polymerase lambda